PSGAARATACGRGGRRWSFWLVLYPAYLTPISSLALHDALPIFAHARLQRPRRVEGAGEARGAHAVGAHADLLQGARHGRDHAEDRKRTRLNSSHVKISYAVFCVQKKKSAELTGARGRVGGGAHF